MNTISKRTLLLLIAYFITANLFGQIEKKNSVGMHTSFGFGDYGSLFSKGSPNYDIKYYCTVGLDYSRRLSDRWELCSGVEYTYSAMTMTPAPTGDTGRDNSKNESNLTLATVPVQFKYHLGNVVYLNGGLLFNILGKESTTASWDGNKYDENIGMLLGIGIGIGFKHEFNSGIVLSLNPYARWNGIGEIGGLQSSPQIKDEKLLQAGISFGIGYRF